MVMPTDPAFALVHRLAADLRLRPAQIGAVAALLAHAATVPFIARYRKEATGVLDEVAIAAIRDGLERLRELEKRRVAIVASLEERQLLTPALASAIAAATTLTAL